MISTPTAAELIFHGGTILTIEADRPRAEALAAAQRLRAEQERARLQHQAAEELLQLERSVAEERLRHQRALAAQHAVFRTAVEGMSQGVWLFDGEGRMAMTNDRCAEIFGFPTGFVRHGGSLGELLLSLRAAGYLTVAEALVRLERVLAEGRPASFVQDLGGGRAVEE